MLCCLKTFLKFPKSDLDIEPSVFFYIAYIGRHASEKHQEFILYVLVRSHKLKFKIKTHLVVAIKIFHEGPFFVGHFHMFFLVP